MLTYESIHVSKYHHRPKSRFSKARLTLETKISRKNLFVRKKIGFLTVYFTATRKISTLSVRFRRRPDQFEERRLSSWFFSDVFISLLLNGIFRVLLYHNDRFGVRFVSRYSMRFTVVCFKWLSIQWEIRYINAVYCVVLRKKIIWLLMRSHVLLWPCTEVCVNNIYIC